MPGGLQNAALAIHQDQVGVAAHHLQDQPAQHMVAHFVHGVQVDVHHAVAADLSDRLHPRAHQLLAQEHAEHGRLQGIGEGGSCQVAAGVVRRGAQEQAAVFVPGADKENDGILLRLGDFINAAAGQGSVQLPGGKADGQSVHGHGESPLHQIIPPIIMHPAQNANPVIHSRRGTYIPPNPWR